MKHPGISNSADLMTKVKPRSDIMKFLGLMGFEVGSGRPTIAPTRFAWTIDKPCPAPATSTNSMDSIDMQVVDGYSGLVNDGGGFRYASYMLEGRKLICDRSLPQRSHRRLVQIFNLNDGEVLWSYDNYDHDQHDYEPNFSQWLGIDPHPLWIATWEVDSGQGK